MSEKKRVVRTRQNDKYETYQIGTCEDCGRENVKVRPVEAYSWMSRASRGFYKLCFKCFGPRVTFTSRGKEFYAPTNIIRTPDGQHLEFNPEAKKELDKS